MECMICLRVPTITMYKLNNCSHEVCQGCIRILRAQYENPWRKAGITPAPPNIVRCPMCRTMEQLISIQNLKLLFPAAYTYWFHHLCFATCSHGFTYDPIIPSSKEENKLIQRQYSRSIKRSKNTKTFIYHNKRFLKITK